MTRISPPKRPAASAPGAKLLISTTALAATLGGWAMLAGQTPFTPAETAAPSANQLIVDTSQPQLQLGPIPTVAALAPPPAIAVAQPSAPNQAGQPAANRLPEPAAPAAPVAAVPLRAVNAPPVAAAAPVARTRSSR